MPSVSDIVGPASDDDLQLQWPDYPDMTPNPAARSGATVARTSCRRTQHRLTHASHLMAEPECSRTPPGTGHTGRG